MTKIAESPPAFCASCFGAPGPEHRFVDFEAAYDGPVVPGSPAHIPVDDLVICDDCLDEAFDLLDPQGKNERIAELEQKLADKEASILAKDKAIRGLESTTSELVHHPPQKINGRPEIQGVPKKVKKQINEQRFARGKGHPKKKEKV